MNKLIQKLVCSLLVTLPLGSVLAQEQPSEEQSTQEYSQHEFSVYGGMGLSTLNYSIKSGSQTDKMGQTLGIGYTYFFAKNIGISTGVELAFYNAKLKIDGLNDEYTAHDGEEDFQFRSSLRNYSEKQYASYLQIPIRLQYQLDAFDAHQFYVAFGGKLGFAMNGKYKNESANLKTSGYYPGKDLWIDDAPVQGFGDFRSRGIKEDLKLKTAFLLSFETGFKWKLNDKLHLYTSAYFDYGLNNVLKEDGTRLVDYNNSNPTNYVLNSALTSKVTQENTTQSLTKKVKPIAVGIKFKLALDDLF